MRISQFGEDLTFSPNCEISVKISQFEKIPLKDYIITIDLSDFSYFPFAMNGMSLISQ